LPLIAPYTTETFAKTDRPKILIHADAHWFNHVAGQRCRFYNRLVERAEDDGAKAFIIPTQEAASNTLSQTAKDVVHMSVGAEKRDGPRVFYTLPTYIKTFWYLDPMGMYWSGSLVERSFHPENIDQEKALWFYRKIRRQVIGRNTSKIAIPDRAEAPLPTAKAAFFAQDVDDYPSAEKYMRTEEILETLARKAGGLVYVKTHPLQKPKRLKAIKRLCAKHETLRLIDANIHDVVAASEAIVSQNSAVGFEALLQRKPVLTCAATDYHHATLVCYSAGGLALNLKRAPEHATRFTFAKYIYWFLGLCSSLFIRNT